jgi:hypothetical protein
MAYFRGSLHRNRQRAQGVGTLAASFERHIPDIEDSYNEKIHETMQQK